MPVYFNSYSVKKPKKLKFKSADAKRAYELAVNSSFGIAEKRYKKEKFIMVDMPDMTPPPGRSTSNSIPSRGSGIGNALKKPDKIYTGTKMIGVGTLHKSNAVPVFSDEEAINMANMRR